MKINMRIPRSDDDNLGFSGDELQIEIRPLLFVFMEPQLTWFSLVIVLQPLYNFGSICRKRRAALAAIISDDNSGRFEQRQLPVLFR